MHGTSVPESSIIEVASAASGQDEKLSLRFIEVSDRPGADFFELAWLRRSGGAWERIASLSSAQFQVGCNTRRWVSKLHSFNASEAKSILQVAETTALGTHYKAVYSWRTFIWLPGGVVQLDLLQLCNDPFEPFAHGG